MKMGWIVTPKDPNPFALCSTKVKASSSRPHRRSSSSSGSSIPYGSVFDVFRRRVIQYAPVWHPYQFIRIPPP